MVYHRYTHIKMLEIQVPFLSALQADSHRKYVAMKAEEAPLSPLSPLGEVCGCTTTVIDGL